jgi:hypothetical protein
MAAILRDAAELKKLALLAMAAVDHRNPGKIRRAKPVFQGERMRWRQCCDVAIAMTAG